MMFTTWRNSRPEDECSRTVPPGVLGPRSAAYDLGYGVPDTPFVRWARAHGAARAEQGFGMLVEQAAESFRIWRGVRPDTASLHREAAAR
jgi:shikimate dehydrogenase